MLTWGNTRQLTYSKKEHGKCVNCKVSDMKAKENGKSEEGVVSIEYRESKTN